MTPSKSTVMERDNLGGLFQNKNLSQMYIKYRPNYNNQLFNKIRQVCKDSGTNFDLAVDVGCGSGQGTESLAKYFNKVTAVDISDSQIHEAKLNSVRSNIDYIVGKAEDLHFIGDNSVDLVTSAEAVHFFDVDLFIQEVDRILKPNGLLIIYGYFLCTLAEDDLNALCDQFQRMLLVPANKTALHLLESQYKEVPLPYTNNRRDTTFEVKKDMTADGLIGYFLSAGYFQRDKLVCPDFTKQLEIFEQKLKDRYSHKTFTVTWKAFMAYTQKPQPGSKSTESA